MTCAHCGEPIKAGRPSLSTPWVHAGARMHPPCAVRSEAGEMPPRRGEPSAGLFQLLGSSRIDRQSSREDNALAQLKRMAANGG